MQSFWLIFQLLASLTLGFAMAKHLPAQWVNICFKILPYFSYILLISIAFEFSHLLKDLKNPQNIVFISINLALCSSLGAFVCSFFLCKWAKILPHQGKVSIDLVLKSLANLSSVLFSLILGYVLYTCMQYFEFNFSLSTWHLLLIFMSLIGIDLAFSPLDRAWLNWKILIIPLGCIIGSVIGVMIFFIFYQDIKLIDLIMLSQGYGFYSMSSVVISELRNTHLGSIALMNDIFREVFAIVLMYCIGWRYPRSAISAAGATAMDVTLPMIKQACGNTFIPHAMMSGFILSILAPIAVSILAALSSA